MYIAGGSDIQRDMKGNTQRTPATRTAGYSTVSADEPAGEEDEVDERKGMRCRVSGDPIFATIIVIVFVWMAIDTYVILHEDSDFWKYLTNWVWMIGGGIRGWVLISRIIQSNAITGQAGKGYTVEKMDRDVLAPLWTALGVAQIAVMGTFFVIILIDSAVVEYHLNKADSARCDQVIGWNHLRHVTPVLFHFTLTLCDGAWFTNNVQGKERGCAGCTGYSATWQALVLGIGLPVVGSVVYMLSADEQDVYKWRHDSTGIWAGVAFGVSCLFGGFVYLCLVPAIMHSDRPMDFVPQIEAKATPTMPSQTNDRKEVTRGVP